MSLYRQHRICKRSDVSCSRNTLKKKKIHPNTIGEQRLEAAQTKFLRHLLGITKLDKKRINVLGKKNGSTEHSKGNKTVPGKVATTHTEDGHKENTKTSTTI